MHGRRRGAHCRRRYGPSASLPRSLLRALHSEKLSGGRRHADASYHQASSNATANSRKPARNWPLPSSMDGRCSEGPKRERGELEISSIYQTLLLPLVSETRFAFPQPLTRIHLSELCRSALLLPGTAAKAGPQLREGRYL